MNDLEERLRTVTRAAAGQIPSDGLQPLRLPAGGRLRRAAFRLTTRISPLGAATARWQRWLAPLATAAAVIGLVAGSITIAHTVSGHPAKRPAGAKTTATTPAATAKLPPYYVTLPYSARASRPAPGYVLIRATATGKLVATVPPPKGEEFTGVSGASDDATFVLTAETPAQVRYVETHSGRPSSGLAGFTAPARFYLLRFDSAMGTTPVTPLNIPVLQGVTSFALSADGTRLAVSTATTQTVGLTVYSVGTGASRSWTQSTYQGGKRKWFTAYGEPWTEGDKVEVSVLTPKGRSGVIGLLDTSGPGGNLLAAIHPFPPGPCWADALDPDGNLGTGAVASKHGIPYRLQECAYRHGQARVIIPGRALYYRGQPVDLNGPLWISPDGGTMIAAGVAGPAQAPTTGVAGPLAGNQLRALPGSGAIPQLSIWPGAAAAW